MEKDVRRDDRHCLAGAGEIDDAELERRLFSVQSETAARLG
jgi:hypothetical protein